jgi:RNA polymerase sigma-70 factor, ECF subfamily
MSTVASTSPEWTGWVSDLARGHTTALALLARSEGLGPVEALDAVQEAFVTVLRMPGARALGDVPGEGRALMGALVRNAARNMRRRHYRARPHAELDAEGGLVDALPSVDDLIGEAEAHLRMRGCVSRLDEIHRAIVEMRMLEEVSGEEVASRLDLSPGHVAVLLHRAKQRLHRCMSAG